ncbi:MAG: hypothetical protein ABFD12_08435 [Syntrophorhabdus sp.]
MNQQRMGVVSEKRSEGIMLSRPILFAKMLANGGMSGKIDGRTIAIRSPVSIGEATVRYIQGLQLSTGLLCSNGQPAESF